LEILVRTDLTELEQRILCDLEEADAVTENVFALINSVTSAKGAQSEVVELVTALRSLMERELIHIGLGTDDHRRIEQSSTPNSLYLIDELPHWFRYDSGTPHWTLSKGEFLTDRYPFASLTRHGRQRAREVLETRGFRWWNRK
jgi:hypothetical protein